MENPAVIFICTSCGIQVFIAPEYRDQYRAGHVECPNCGKAGTFDDVFGVTSPHIEEF